VTQGMQRTVKPLIPEEPGPWNTQDEPDDCKNDAECQALYPWKCDGENNYRYQLVRQPKTRQEPDEVASAEIQHVRREQRIHVWHNEERGCENIQEKIWKKNASLQVSTKKCTAPQHLDVTAHLKAFGNKGISVTEQA
jgi:hypothetical protein